MELPTKKPDHIVPEYSLTGDLLSYQRCALQYRYYNRSSLPPSRPVQLWYGEFIHRMLEVAFLLWRESGGTLAFPWPYTAISDVERPEAPPPNLSANDIRVIGWPIEKALMHEGKRARSRRARQSAYRRADAAINLLAPHLFPLISDAEQKIIGTRSLPVSSGDAQSRSEHYVLHGVIDVLTNVELSSADATNVIRDAVQKSRPDLQGHFEVVVDYKGSHRPATGDDQWKLGEWQVRTYAWLRERQQLTRPVAAGILVYINELSPSTDDVRRMRVAIEKGQTDVAPRRGSADYYALESWTPGTEPRLSETFRFQRAIRVVPVDRKGIDEATRAFDEIVAEIESRIREETSSGSILKTWGPTCQESETCAACDFRHFCPSPAAGTPSANGIGDNDGV